MRMTMSSFQRLVLLVLSAIALSLSASGFQNVCQREPQNTLMSKEDGDGGFSIIISGNPEKYLPGEVYTVSLQGEKSHYNAQKFAGFMLIIEAASPSEHFGPPQSVGTFQLYGDALSKHSEGCPNAIIQTSNILKSDIQVRWTAPPSGSGCIRFKATVIESRDSWYMDDGELSKRLCEDVRESEEMQPSIVHACNTCDEAKYEVTFEGLWSRQTHPRDFPANEWLTHFSDIIGASHSNDYRMWEYGGLASDGLKQVAEWGSTRSLESELKRQSNHIRTIVKARGLWYPNVNGKTFAVFRVDNRHHLMSLVSMLGPSPDWIVGVSALELCLRNDSWVAQKTLNLYPWDAGTDSGVSYMAVNTPSIPRHKIRRITNAYPNDPKNPFHDTSGRPMKPLARLTITRQRVYEKSCALPGVQDSRDSNRFDTGYRTNEYFDSIVEAGVDDRVECRTTEWSKFSHCSVTCGKGLLMRTRQYFLPMKAEMLRCQSMLEEREMCKAQIPICEHGNAYNIFGATTSQFRKEKPLCRTTDWSRWSQCSATCGKGIQTRSRRFMDRMGRKKCDKQLNERKDCMAAVSECEEEYEVIDPACAVTQWTNWSPCSATCGKGVRVRTRFFLVPTGSENDCGLKTMDKMICEGERKSCIIDESEAKEVCLQKKDVGPCRGYFPRWFYDTERRMCMQFIYGGCRGNRNSNRNNFEKYDDCTRMCEFSRDELHVDTKPVFPSQSNGHSSYSDTGHKFGGLVPENQLAPSVDCIMSDWSTWTTCSVTCGSGWKEKRRMIKVKPQNGGKSCPRKTVKRHKCKPSKCNKAIQHNLESMSFRFDPFSDYTSPILPSSNQLNSFMKEPHGQHGGQHGQHGQRGLGHETQEELMREMDRKNPNEDCVMGDWGPWSPCTHSCGSESLQQRARSIVVKARGGGVPCGPSLERRYCTLPPCPHPRG